MSPVIVIIDPDAAAAWVTRAGIERSSEGAHCQIVLVQDVDWPLPGEQPPAVVIIDPVPYGLRGVRLIQRLREEAPATQIIVLASAAPRGLQANLLGLGVAVYLEKTSALPQIVAQLSRVLALPAANMGRVGTAAR